MRGTRSIRPVPRAQRRFIPARAGNTIELHSATTTGPVHPRACGEHVLEDVLRPDVHGSSPRVRGTPGLSACTSPKGRFIPARAGNTTSLNKTIAVSAVHPRACGEHYCRRKSLLGKHGSSPRVRGTPSQPGPGVRELRFIPARAGNTVTPPVRYEPTAVHPRACGEHFHRRHATPSESGSSPRVRGTRGCAAFSRHEPRFIPARAGNTRTAAVRFAGNSVHPRACGEHGRRVIRRVKRCGSSPRVRGTRVGSGRTVIRNRFIPARAGNTRRFCFSSFESSVHPRACGEHRSRSARTRPACGSSPRVRGTRSIFYAEEQSRRFIPARAGNTNTIAWSPGSSTVHPRACGEHGKGPASCGPAFGSSPRVRGTRAGHVQRAVRRRFIPARAGNTRAPPRPTPNTTVHPRACGEH